MTKPVIKGKVHLKGYTLLVIIIPHDSKTDLMIFEELFDTVENYGIDYGLKYVEIASRKRLISKFDTIKENKLYVTTKRASEYIVLLEKIKFI